MRIKFETIPCFLVILLLFCVNQIRVVSDLCLKDQRSLLLQLKSNLTYYYSPANSTNLVNWNESNNGCCEGMWNSAQLLVPVSWNESICCEWMRSNAKLVSWNESIGCCEWSGVTCDDEGHVSGLDLSKEWINGGFHSSSSLFNLQHLQYLNLAFNHFNSTIPSRFDKLENLTYLNLSYAGFIGDVPSEEISYMTRLVTLDLSKNFELSLINLRDLVKNLINIRHLYLDNVKISAGGEEWNSALLQIPTLQEIGMSGCKLTGPLESSLTTLENLSFIRLDYNNFSSPVPETFANFKNLTTLSLSCCWLTEMFPQKIFQLPTLTLIDISYNPHLNGFFPDFSLNAYLQHLIVADTNFSRRLPNSIGNLRNLTTLDLSHSQFNGALPNALSNLTQLEDLYLSTNSFGGSIPSLTLCTKLKRVFLIATTSW